MKTLIIALLVLGLAVVVGLVLHTDPGQVVLGYETYTIETSLAFLLVTVAVVFTVFYLVLRTLGGVLELPKWMGRRRVIRRREKSQRALTRGLLALAEGRWDSAEQELSHNAQHRSTALLGFLGAAQAAQEKGNLAKRDQHLRNAEALGREAELSVGLTQARLQLVSGQDEAALASLAQLARDYPRNNHILALQARLLRDRGEWGHLLGLLPTLRKRKALIPAEINALQHEAWLGDLNSANYAELNAHWDHLPKRAREDADTVAALARRRIASGDVDAAERLLRTVLNRRWNDQLITLYGEVETQDTARQVDHAERWLRSQSQSAALLATLGRLCVRRQLWGKARSAFESSLNLQPDATTQRRYAALLEQLDEPEAAREAYRQGLLLALGESPDGDKALVPSADDAEGHEASEAGASGHLRVVDGKG